MVREGTLTFVNNEALLDHVLLGIQFGQPNPIAAANNRLQTAGFHNNERVHAEGVVGRIGEVVVFFLTRITHAVAISAFSGPLVDDNDQVTVSADGGVTLKPSAGPRTKRRSGRGAEVQKKATTSTSSGAKTAKERKKRPASAPGRGKKR